jgi:hypothetical protein
MIIIGTKEYLDEFYAAFHDKCSWYKETYRVYRYKPTARLKRLQERRKGL